MKDMHRNNIIVVFMKFVLLSSSLMMIYFGIVDPLIGYGIVKELSKSM